MNRKKQKGRLICLKANGNELKMLSVIMEKDGRNSISDALRTLIRDRFFFLTSNMACPINNLTCDNAPTTEVCGNP